ncbi:hypothetical protein [Halomonas sp. KHS3]|uniref:hypothetical protein n=1 Tax=Halomonas sp. KHS3 TaxID=866350 RepID=UPI00059B468C|nr:hypothetical protein [Halomonas sp. KHS3]KIN13466.1 hypothetical protein RO22_19555 [Halomonas sp. KHS3]
MQYRIVIDQPEALRHGLNLQQAAMLAYVREASRWAEEVNQGGVTYRAITKRQIIEALPLLTDKPDTAYRLLKVLEHKGLVALSHTEFSTLVRVLDGGGHVR